MFGSTTSTGLFGNQSTPSKPGSLFGSTQPTSTQSTGLFGSQPTSTQFGSGGGNLFGSTQSATQSSGTGLFGTQPASTGTGLFGTNQSASAQPSTGGNLFGSTQPATQSSGTGLFGSTTQTGGSLFGTQNTTGGSLFGPNPSAQQQQQGQQSSSQRQLSEIVTEAIAIRTSLIEPKLYGDDSDATILRLNQLLAACGIGSGYYDKDKPPVTYDPSNPYFQFRAIGYCALSQHKDSDGIVAFILRQPADSLSAVQERQKLIDSIRLVLSENQPASAQPSTGGNLFGPTQPATQSSGNPITPNPDIHAHIINIRPLTEQLCEVELFVTKVGSGKINAKQLYAYLDHPDRTKIKQEKLPQCEKIVPRVEMSQEDIKRYLSSPPKGFSESEWRQAIIDNPDQQNLLPYPIYGYKELDDRRQRQLKERDVQRKSLQSLNDRLKTATQDIQQINGLKKIFHEDAKRLRHRILRIT
jgi:nuclear pore complex protein Nup54